MLASSKQWHLDHPEKVKEYQRRYYQKKTAAKREKKKPNPDIDKANSLFRDPAMAEHLQWLLDHAASKNK